MAGLRVLYCGRITRETVRAHPRVLFVFGDNMERRGMGGQAREMRGEPNAVGIPTKWSPHRGEGAYFSDADFDEVRPTIDREFSKLRAHQGDVVWPRDGIGTGLAKLPVAAPKIWAYLESCRTSLTTPDRDAHGEEAREAQKP